MKVGIESCTAVPWVCCTCVQIPTVGLRPICNWFPPQDGNKGVVKLIGTLSNKPCNAVYWSPQVRPFRLFIDSSVEVRLSFPEVLCASSLTGMISNRNISFHLQGKNIVLAGLKALNGQVNPSTDSHSTRFLLHVKY